MFKYPIFPPLFAVLLTTYTTYGATPMKDTEKASTVATLSSDHAALYALLTTNPAKALTTARSARVEFDKEVQEKTREICSHKRIEDVIHSLCLLQKTHEEKHPYFFLLECTGFFNNPPTEPCLLSRLHRPHIRDFFKNFVADKINETLKDSDSLTYASFGCGKCFLDATILAGVAQKNQPKSISVHLIDPTLQLATLYATFFGKSRKVETEKECDFDFLKKDLQEKTATFITHLKKIGVLEEIPPEKNFMLIAITLQETNTLCKHLENSIRAFFPKTTDVSITLHESGESYINYCAKNHISLADCLIAADIEDSVSLQKGSLKDCIKLFITSLQTNPKALCFYLGTDHKTEHKPGIIQQFSLSENAEKTTIITKTLIPE